MNNLQTVDTRGAADLLKVHPKTVADLISTGAIPAAKVGRSYVMLVKDVMDYLEKRILSQTATRMRATTKAPRPGHSRADSHNASTPAGSGGR